MNSGMTSTAAKAGITLAIGNYNYPDKSDALSQAQAIALRNPKAVISFNVDKTILDTVNKNFSDKCIPIIQVTLAAPNSITFGASDEQVGTTEGEYLVDYAKKQGWDPATIVAYGVQVPTLAAINTRVTTCQQVITSGLAGAKAASTEIQASTTANSQTATTNWLTANPQVKHILGCNIADVLALGEVNALQAANRSEGSAILGAGGTPSVLALVGKSALIGSVDFGYGHYADFLLAMAQDAIDGKPVPTKVFTPLKVITSA
jgi:ABC-type sugar transport system substrate-binding protein